MNDKQLRLFLSVADQGSFSKAETVEYISKQAILRQIDALEEEAGVALLRRSSAGVELTPAGREFYQGAKKLLKLREQVLAKCRGAEAAPEEIRIGQVEHQALLHRVTDAFAVKYPDILIRKVIHPNHSGEYRVENGIVDVGETFYTDAVAHQSTQYRKLADIPYRVAMAPGHPLSGRERCPLRALTAYPTFFFRPMVKPEYQAQLEQVFRAAGREENLLPRCDVDNQVEVAFQCGASRALLLTANCFVLDIPEVTTVLLEEGWSQEYGIICGRRPSPAAQKYVDLALSLFGGGEQG